MPRFTFKASIFLLLIFLGACGGKDESAVSHEHSNLTYTCPMHPQIVAQEPGRCPICGMDLVAIKREGGDAPILMLSESQILLANIKTRKASLGGEGGAAVLTGRIVENQELNELISSRVPGRIERLYVKEAGQRIREGAPLYEIYSEELLTIQQEYLLALEQFKQLGEEEPRYASFLESAKRKLKLYGMTDAQIRQLASGQKSNPLITFLAPVSGVVTNISVVEGQYVQEGSPLYTLTGLDPLWVEAEVYEGDLEKVKEGMDVPVQVAGFSRPVMGQITFVSPEFRGSSQVVEVRVSIPNPDGAFIPGMQANVLLPLRSGESAEELLNVPVEAVIRDQDGAHVWIKSGENTFEPRVVQTAETTADQVVITGGLDKEDVVVISGAYLLYSEFVLKKGADPLAAAKGYNMPEKKDKMDPEEPIAFKNTEFALAFAHYQELKNAMIASDVSKIKEQAAALQLALKAIPEGKVAGEYVQKISLTDQLEEQRQFFFFLNNNFIALAEEAELLSGKLYVQFCPMANNGQGAYWLSVEEKILNPYLPENMLTCGEVKDIIE